MSERVHCSLAQATLRGPCTTVVTGHHRGRRKAKAPGLKKVPDRPVMISGRVESASTLPSTSRPFPSRR
eukprot:2386512-Rhodomonas_salina.1